MFKIQLICKTTKLLIYHADPRPLYRDALHYRYFSENYFNKTAPNSIDCQNNRFYNARTPISKNDLATKDYVDSRSIDVD